MRRNRNLAMKLRDNPGSETPRVDRFIKTHVFIMPGGLPNDVALEIAQRVRELMIDWGMFARELEREVMQSVPKEWPKQVEDDRLG